MGLAFQTQESQPQGPSPPGWVLCLVCGNVLSCTDGCGKRSAGVTVAKVKALGHMSTCATGNRQVRGLVDVFEKRVSWWVDTAGGAGWELWDRGRGSPSHAHQRGMDF